MNAAEPSTSERIAEQAAQFAAARAVQAAHEDARADERRKLAAERSLRAALEVERDHLRLAYEELEHEPAPPETGGAAGHVR